jgi:hypothetical protein
MIKRIFLFFLSIAFYGHSFAQVKARVQYSGSAAWGILRGSRGISFEVQTVQGIRYKGYYLGAGVGIDRYYMKSVPLFAALRKDILNHKKTPFIYFNIGTNYPWQNEKRNEWWLDSWYKSETLNGLYVDGGIGYTLPLKGRMNFLVSLGYSQKNRVEESNWGSIMYDPTFEHYSYQFRRYSLKLGLSL